MRLAKQARRCEQVAYRLELLSMHACDDKVGAYITLNQQALKKVEEVAEEKLEWERDIKGTLKGSTRMQVGNVMLIPWMKRVAAKYHARSSVEKKKAMDVRGKETQTLYSMKGKGQREINKPMRGDAATPLAALRRKVKGP